MIISKLHSHIKSAYFSSLHDHTLVLALYEVSSKSALPRKLRIALTNHRPAKPSLTSHLLNHNLLASSNPELPLDSVNRHSIALSPPPSGIRREHEVLVRISARSLHRSSCHRQTEEPFRASVAYLYQQNLLHERRNVLIFRYSFVIFILHSSPFPNRFEYKTSTRMKSSVLFTILTLLFTSLVEATTLPNPFAAGFLEARCHCDGYCCGGGWCGDTGTGLCCNGVPC
ncbi:hypothetical protein B0O99DRAFT_630654 [Bisporella sp. PMI_857]|nr:hypothetical protein B0O99DRAFT_630654 [Bisporella sp. PMI_857]